MRLTRSARATHRDRCDRTRRAFQRTLGMKLERGSPDRRRMDDAQGIRAPWVVARSLPPARSEIPRLELHPEFAGRRTRRARLTLIISRRLAPVEDEELVAVAGARAAPELVPFGT